MSCSHKYQMCPVPHYEVCSSCGTFHSTAAIAPEEVYGSGYWSDARPLMQEQAWNVDMHIESGVSKNRFVLDRIASERGAALDIGCAPGRLLFWLKWAARFKKVVGIDPDDPREIKSAGCFDGDVHTGLFPEVTVKWEPSGYDLIVGLDVFEHSACPHVFLKECHRLLKPGGQLMLMMPLADDLGHHSRFFAPAEHVFIHSQKNVDEMLHDCGLASRTHSRWAVGHDVVSSRKW